jgi:hypothetical protein
LPCGNGGEGCCLADDPDPIIAYFDVGDDGSEIGLSGLCIATGEFLRMRREKASSWPGVIAAR